MRKYVCDAQGQASDIMIRAQEIIKMKEILSDIYVKHTGQTKDIVGKRFGQEAASVVTESLPVC
jgi:ATP-dependent Clp protease protease subunit